MKKFLLFSVAAMMVASASAADNQNVIATMYPGNAGLIGWGADTEALAAAGIEKQLEVVTEDGREALMISNASEKDPWAVQFAFDTEYEVGTTYYFTFDVKGDPFDAVGSCFQCTDGWVGCGDLTSFAITSDWKTVTISGTVTDPGEGKKVDRWVASIGKYIGSFYISNMSLYTLEEGGETPDEPVAGKVVYSIDYATTPWNFYVMGYTPEVIDGVLTSNLPDKVDENGEVVKDENGNVEKAWYQYFIADQIPTEVGKSYVATVKIKTSTNATLALNMGWGWGENDILKSTINTTPEWAEISQTFENIGGEKCNLVLQPGMYDGTVEIEWVKVAEAESSSVEAIAPAVENNRTVVYNLMGVKVLDTDDASQLNTLKKGIYIVNGKKVAL